MRKIDNTFKIYGLITLGLAGLVTASAVANGKKTTPAGIYGGQNVSRVYDYKEITITKSNFTFEETKNIYNDITIDIFNFTVTTNQVGAKSAFFTFKTPETQRFTQENEVGSNLNKWHLTSLTMTLGKYTPKKGNTNLIKINDYNAFSYIGVAETTSNANLEAHKETFNATFDFDYNITTFQIKPSTQLYISSMTLGYTIDYTDC